jgi:hypothetical protein
MFKSANEFPRLKGRASEIKHIGEPLLAVFCKYMNVADRNHQLVRMGLKCSVRIETILYECQREFRFTDQVHKEFLQNIYDFLACVTALGHYHHPRGDLLFHYTIKNHYMCHCGLLSKYLNPRLGWNYSGEDFMQKVKDIVGSCNRATKPPLVCSKSMGKYVSGLGFVLSTQRLWQS